MKVVMLSENSTLLITLQPRSDDLVNITINVTIQHWSREGFNVNDVQKALVDKPAESSPSINYIYPNINSSMYHYLSMISLTSLSTYILVNVEQDDPHACYLVSLQNASISPAEETAAIKRFNAFW